MKKWCWILLMGLLFAGCGQENMETVADSYGIPQTPEPQEVYLELPEDAAMLTLKDDADGTLYLCQDYTVTVQTLAGGDLDRTLRQVSGFGADELRIYTVEYNDYAKHACVWTSAGEETEQVGKALIWDDGVHHYAVTVMMPAERAGELEKEIRQILDSVELE